MRKYRVLFDLNMQYHFNSLFPVYKAMEKDEQFDIWFRAGKDPFKILHFIKISRSGKIAEKLRNKGCRLTDETKGFDIVISGDALENPTLFGDCIRLTLDHGVGIKTSRIRNIVAQKDYHYHVVLEGQYWFDYIKSLGWETKATFHKIGMPKLDPLFKKGFYKPKELLADLNLDADKPTVLFAPSYKPTCIDYIGEQIVDLVPEYNLIIKLHPYSWGGRYAPHKHHYFFQKLAKRHKDIYLIPQSDYDIYPYLIAADTIISETSSVIHEFLALGKFGIIFDLPHYKEKHSDGMEILSVKPEQWLLGAYPHFSDANSLLKVVHDALNPTNDMKDKLKYYRDYIFTGLDGNASLRVKKLILDLLKDRI